MPVKALIIDPRTGRAANVVDEEEYNAVVVATRPLKTFKNKIKFFFHPDYGYNMNIACGFSGTPVPIHNGTDNAYWTGSVVVGTWIFDSVAQAHAGAKSVDATATVNNSIAQFTKAAAIDLTGYAAITGWIYLDSWDDQGTKGIQIYGWDVGTSSQVGAVIDLRDYINIGLTDSWQKFAVSLDNFGLVGETMDAIRVKTIDVGPGDAPDYYLDDIQIEENADPVEFTIRPDLGKWLHVNTYSIFIVDAYASTLADATMPFLSYDKLLGVTSLENGILYQRIINGETPLSFPFRNLGEILSFPGASILSCGGDATNTFLKILVDLREPIILKAEDEDEISFTVSDNLTGLKKLIISANCKEEQR
jgi:hypothetical protein